jgi:CheY-like chemotaxis protein
LLAFNGEEAPELSKAHPEISLVLMDIKMPVMDGLEAHVISKSSGKTCQYWHDSICNDRR